MGDPSGRASDAEDRLGGSLGEIEGMRKRRQRELDRWRRERALLGDALHVAEGVDCTVSR